MAATGSGKSSIVEADLIAQLHQGKQFLSDQWLIKTIRPGVYPLNPLVRKLREGNKEAKSHEMISSSFSPTTPSLILEGMLYQGVEGFVYWLRSRPEPMVVLVVDQFEELFPLSERQGRQFFLELLLGGLKYASDKFKVVITLRADFIAGCL
ncbi:High-affnity carbon uptake protein Hat/HatR [Richelia intracellularis]|nr:High-affnity carbon uptake protein Hat/HatR [Richelia intracellularis]